MLLLLTTRATDVRRVVCQLEALLADNRVQQTDHEAAELRAREHLGGDLEQPAEAPAARQWVSGSVVGRVNIIATYASDE